MTTANSCIQAKHDTSSPFHTTPEYPEALQCPRTRRHRHDFYPFYGRGIQRSAESAGAADVLVDVRPLYVHSKYYVCDVEGLTKEIEEIFKKEAPVVDTSQDDRHMVALCVHVMTCTSSVKAVTKALQEVDGTENVNVDLGTGWLRFRLVVKDQYSSTLFPRALVCKPQ